MIIEKFQLNKRASQVTAAAITVWPFVSTGVVQRDSFLQGNVCRVAEPAVPMTADSIVSDREPLQMFGRPPRIEKWTRGFERQFLKLAELEALDMIDPGQRRRLEMLARERDRLTNMRTPEETLAQIRHDRLLDKMALVLKEYANFKKGKNQAG